MYLTAMTVGQSSISMNRATKDNATAGLSSNIWELKSLYAGRTDLKSLLINRSGAAIQTQKSDLVEGAVVSERVYDNENPADIVEVLGLVLSNCTDFLGGEGTVISQDTIELDKLTLKYPGMAGVIEVIFTER